MLPRFLFITLCIVLSAWDGFSQSSPPDTSWVTGIRTQMNLTQSSFSNWAGGGQNAMSVSGYLTLRSGFKRSNTSFQNKLDMAYGILMQKGVSTQKTDDKIEFTSQYSVRAWDFVKYTSLLSFKTQFAEGFNPPNDSIKISDFFAPAYGLLSIGLEYSEDPCFSFLLSPLTGKLTVVLDDSLNAIGAFGVTAGDAWRLELGGFARVNMECQLGENIKLNTKFEAFSNYLENPQNIDINWETLIEMKVNSHISTNISTQLIYDDDVSIALDRNSDGINEGKGPRVQFKEVLAIGVVYSF